MKPEVEKLYIENKEALDMFGFEPETLDDEKRDSYVYGWFTKTEPKKYFYIGKGKKDRYKHILDEIDALKDKRKCKGKKYKILQDRLGIDYEFLYNDLTQREAAILESYIMLDYFNKKEPLLNIITPELDDEIEEFRLNIQYEKDEDKFISYYI